jgi:DNA-binding response OmpR family regulator
MTGAPLWAVATGPQVLVVDPEGESAELRDALAVRGVQLTWSRTTADALVAFGRLDPYAVVVAPDVSGGAAGPTPAEFVATIKRHGSPYVIAAVCGAPDAASAALLDAGASAWVSRPYSARELWERLSSSPYPIEEHTRVVVGPVELDTAAYSVHVDGRRIPDLPLKEFELLRALMLRAPEVVSDDEVREALWGSGPGAPGGNTIAMHATRLRGRLGGTASVRRVRGRGYALSVDG